MIFFLYFDRFCIDYPDQRSCNWGTLSLMFSDFYSDRSLIWTQAFVSQVKKFTVKTLCTKCSSLSSRFKCSDKTCNNILFDVSIFAWYVKTIKVIFFLVFYFKRSQKYIHISIHILFTIWITSIFLYLFSSYHYPVDCFSAEG